jgi:HAD superfamily hydrolase (TIGR01450 family)
MVVVRAPSSSAQLSRDVCVLLGCPRKKKKKRKYKAKGLVAMNAHTTRVCRGLEQIFDGDGGGKTMMDHDMKRKKKKAVLLDQFGVLHDGVDAYPGAVEAVRYLREDCGLRILILSNSSRRSDGALKNLEKKGFDIGCFDGVVTSGEVTHQRLKERPDGFWKSRKACVHFTWGERGAISLDDLGVDVVGRRMEEADFLLAHGTQGIGKPGGVGVEECSVDDMVGMLDECVHVDGSSKPMVVANPDIVTVHGGDLIKMPGYIAKEYEERGGEVCRMGKPARVIYEEALRMLGVGVEEVIAIGDSLEHDIKGAESMGIDSIFVGGGIHKDRVMTQGDRIDEDSLDRICHEYSCAPTFVIPYFCM